MTGDASEIRRVVVFGSGQGDGVLPLVARLRRPPFEVVGVVLPEPAAAIVLRSSVCPFGPLTEIFFEQCSSVVEVAACQIRLESGVEERRLLAHTSEPFPDRQLLTGVQTVEGANHQNRLFARR